MKAKPEYRFCLKSPNGKLFGDTLARTKIECWRKDCFNIVSECTGKGFFITYLNSTETTQIKGAKRIRWEIVNVKIAEDNET